MKYSNALYSTPLVVDLFHLYIYQTVALEFLPRHIIIPRYTPLCNLEIGIQGVVIHPRWFLNDVSGNTVSCIKTERRSCN